MGQWKWGSQLEDVGRVRLGLEKVSNRVCEGLEQAAMASGWEYGRESGSTVALGAWVRADWEGWAASRGPRACGVFKVQPEGPQSKTPGMQPHLTWGQESSLMALCNPHPDPAGHVPSSLAARLWPSQPKMSPLSHGKGRTQRETQSLLLNVHPPSGCCPV